MKVSVIIPTYNGVDKISNLLSALDKQTVVEFEVIVVIDGSNDGTYEYLSEVVSTRFPLQIINQPNKGRAGARNAGVILAKNDLLVFYDDDMMPEPNSLEKHLEFHLKVTDSILGGNQLENRRNAKNDFDLYRCDRREKWNSPYKKLEKLGYHNLHLTAANFSILRSTFNSLGGFDERLSDAEDIYFAHIAHQNGYNIYFDPANIAWHNDFVTCSRYIKRLRQYHKAYEFLRELEPDSKWILKRTIRLNQFKKIFYSLFSNSWVVKLVEKEYLLFLPKKLRYKLYSIVVTGLGKVYNGRRIEA